MIASHLIKCLQQQGIAPLSPSSGLFLLRAPSHPSISPSSCVIHLPSLHTASYGSRAQGQWDLLGLHEGDLRQKFEAQQKEKGMMAKVPVADNDILPLNVGGTILATKRATLTQVALASVHNHHAGLYRLL